MSVRLRRLQAEYNRVAQLFAGHERIRIVETYGNPPDRYIIEYNLKGLVEEKGQITERGVHRAQIVLGRNYPNELPRCNMLTPVFHPNIDHLRICTEDIGAAGKTIDQVITFIGEMIAFQTYNVKSPLNGDAARWTIEHLDKLPLERIDLIPKESVRPPTISETAQNLSRPQSAPAPAGFAGQQRPAPHISAQTAVLERCVNCGETAIGFKLEDCAGGHRICPDCSLSCENCKTTLCVLCEVRNCANCNSVVCVDCQETCEVSAHTVCLDCYMTCDHCRKGVCVLCEMGNCTACKRLCCAGCLVKCAGCEQSFCSNHVYHCHICQRQKCSDCLVTCERCGYLSCSEHLNSSGLCPPCATEPPAGGTPFKADEGGESNTFNASSDILDLESPSNSQAVTQRPYAQADDVAAYEMKPERDDSFETEEPLSLPSDERLESESGESSEQNSGTTLRAVMMDSDTAVLPGFGVQDEPTAVYEIEPSNPSGQSFQKPRISISKDDVRSIPESAIPRPRSRSIQIIPAEEIKTSGKAVAALIFGVIGIPVMGILLGPFAIIFGSLAIYEINHTDYLAGKPLALTGIYLGIFDIIIWGFIFLLLLVRAFTQASPSPGMTLLAR